MIEELAVVERLDGDSMELRILTPEHCDRCALREGCYSRGNRLSVPRDLGLRQDDQVRLTIVNTSVLGLSALVYGLPLAGFLVGIFGAYYGLAGGLAEAGRGPLALGAGLLGMAVCGLLGGRAGKRLSGSIVYRTERQDTSWAENSTSPVSPPSTSSTENSSSR